MPFTRDELHAFYAKKPAVLAPLEDVSDAVFRRICRGLGADLCVTEFVNVEGLLRGCRNAKRKITLAPDAGPLPDNPPMFYVGDGYFSEHKKPKFD